MASRSRPHRFNRWCLPMLCLVQLCMACLLVCRDGRQLNFVLSVSWDGHRASKTQRFRQQAQSSQGKFSESHENESKKLTSKIKKAGSVRKLLEILDGAVDDPVFGFFQVSAAYYSLATWKRKRALQQSDWGSPVLQRLHSRVREMVQEDEVDERGLANALWSLAQLSDKFGVPSQLLAAVVRAISKKAKGMDAQQLSNCLWATARLKDVAPDVLEMVPHRTAQIPTKAREMTEQALSNSLWAAAKLKDVAPEVLKVVPVITAEVPDKAQDMIPQALSNCLWACLQLQDVAPAVLEIVPEIVGEIPSKNMKTQEFSNTLESLLVLRDSVPEVAKFEDDIVRSAVAQLTKSLPQLSRKGLELDVPTTVWACAKVGVYDGELLPSVAQRLGSRKTVSSLQDFGLCALSWSYQVLCARDQFADFQKMLKSEIKKRRLSEADVQSSKLGYLKWNRAEG